MVKLFQSKTASRRGFTLAEALIVLAIITLLTSITVPSLIGAQRGFKALERNEAARSVFVAAQNSVSAMRANGDISRLASGSIPMEKPSDFPPGLDWESMAADFFCLAGGTGSASLLLPAGSIDPTLAQGTFYIECNLKSGAVYGVFYSEITFSYSEAATVRDTAADSGIGYYGSAAIAYGEYEPLDAPVFHIKNDADSLRVEFSASANLRYSLTVSDGSDSVIYGDLFSLSLTERNIIADGTGYTVIIDGSGDGLGFAELFGDLKPGSELQVTLTAAPVGNSGRLPASSTKTASSLFAAVSGGTAKISNVRHLQNLDALSSGVSGIGSAVLTGDIDCAGADFASISNDMLESFNGSGNTISNLSAPLFARLEGSSVENLRLVNCDISVFDTDFAGALCGYASGTDFRGCRVYANIADGKLACAISSSGALFTGGLVGYAEGCTFVDCSASLTALHADSGAVGGLVGGISGGSAVSCYAATGVRSSAGGG